MGKGGKEGHRHLNSGKHFSVNFAKAFCLHHKLQLDNYLLCYLAVEPLLYQQTEPQSLLGLQKVKMKEAGTRTGIRMGMRTDWDRHGMRWEKQTDLKRCLNPATHAQHRLCLTPLVCAMSPVWQHSFCVNKHNTNASQKMKDLPSGCFPPCFPWSHICCPEEVHAFPV